MIGQKKELGWEFLFIGANIDAVETASRYGISHDRAVNYKADKRGTKVLYDTVSDALCCLRENDSLTPQWSENIQKDLESRNK